MLKIVIFHYNIKLEKVILIIIILMAEEKHSTNAEKVQAILEKHIQQNIDDQLATFSVYDELTNMISGNIKIKGACAAMKDEAKQQLLDMYRVKTNNYTGNKITAKTVKSYQKSGISRCNCQVTGEFRNFFMSIISEKAFEYFILIAIVANCILMAVEPDHHSMDSGTAKFYNTFEYVFQIIYTIEMAMKIIALGFAVGPHAYLKDVWNVMDFVIVVLSWVMLFFGDSNISAIRAVRALRTLRTLSAFPRLAKLVQMLIQILPQMGNICFLCFVTVLVFSCIAMQLFSGTLFHRCVLLTSITTPVNFTQEIWQQVHGEDKICQMHFIQPTNDNDTYFNATNFVKSDKDTCPKGYACLMRQNPGKNQNHFDNIISSGFLVFEMFTLDGWVDEMYLIRQAMDSKVYDLFFIAVVYIGAFFVVNLVCAIQFYYYDMLKRQRAKVKLLKLRQAKAGMYSKEAEKKKRYYYRMKQQEDKWCACGKGWKPSLKNVVLDYRFETVIQIVIFINSITLGSEFHGQPKWWTTVLETTNHIFTVIFTAEMLLKLLALGCIEYLGEAFNVFDFVVVIIGLSEYTGNSRAGGLSVLRGFRVLRVFKLLKKAKGLQMLVKTVLKACADAATLGLLVLLFISINALIGKQLFSGKIFDDDGKESRLHFQDFGSSLQTVFICMTGFWVEPMRNISRQFGGWTSIFFIEVMVFGNFLLLNLFLAIILQNIDIVQNTSSNDSENPKTIVLRSATKINQAHLQEDSCTSSCSSKCSSLHTETDRSLESILVEQTKKSESVMISMGSGVVKVGGVELKSHSIHRRTSLHGMPSSFLKKPLALPKPKYKIKEQTENSSSSKGELSSESNSYECTIEESGESEDYRHANLLQVKKASFGPSVKLWGGDGSLQKQMETPIFNDKINLTSISLTSQSTTNILEAQIPAPRINGHNIAVKNFDRNETELSAGLTESSFISSSDLLQDSVVMSFDPNHYQSNSSSSSSYSTSNYQSNDSYTSSYNLQQMLPKTTTESSQEINFITENGTMFGPIIPLNQKTAFEVRIGDEMAWIVTQQLIQSTANNRIKANNPLYKEVMAVRQNQDWMCCGENTFAVKQMLKVNKLKVTLEAMIRKRRVRRHKNAQKVKKVEGNSLCCFSSKGSFRQLTVAIVRHAYFEQFTLTLILLYSVVLMIDSEVGDKDVYGQACVDSIGNVISLSFVLETFIRVTASGFIMTKTSYMRDPFNCFDFILVLTIFLQYALEIIAQLSHSGESKTITNARSVVTVAKVFRTLRPLRLLKSLGMRNTVECLIAAIPNMMNALMINFLFIYIFSILGVQLFSGRLFHCNDHPFTISTKVDCEAKGAAWENFPQNYDSIFASMLTFFEIQTLEDWHIPAFYAIDAPLKEGFGPILNNRRAVIIIFIFFIFMTTFFILNIIITILITSYQWQTIKKYQLGTFDKDSRRWIVLQGVLLETRPSPVPQAPENALRLSLFHVANSKLFDNFVSFCVAVNTIVLCIEYQGSPIWYQNLLEQCNLVFVMIFAVEAGVKLTGLGPKMYFTINQNIFDFALVIVSFMGFFQELIPINVTAMRVIRGTRILRIFKSLHELSDLLTTLAQSVKSFAYVLLLSFLILFVFGLVGMRFFGGLTKGKYGGLDENANFNDVWLTLTTLTRTETGENWNMLMRDTMAGTGWYAAFYWILFVVVKVHILLNVVIAVIFEKLEMRQSNKHLSKDEKLYREAVNQFTETWQEFDPFATNYISTMDLPDLIKKLPTPLGLGGLKENPLASHERILLQKMIRILNVRDRDGRVYFPEVLWAVYFNLCGVSNVTVNKNELMKETYRQILQTYPVLNSDRHYNMDALFGNVDLEGGNILSAYQYILIVRVQRRWKHMIEVCELDKKCKSCNHNTDKEVSRGLVRGKLYSSPKKQKSLTVTGKKMLLDLVSSPKSQPSPMRGVSADKLQTELFELSQGNVSH